MVYNEGMADITVFVRLTANCVCGATLKVEAELEITMSTLEAFQILHEGHEPPPKPPKP